MLHIILRHLTGSRATQVDILPLGAHRELVLGRAETAAVRFDPRRDDAVGRWHARIERVDGHAALFTLADLESRNGTFLNRRRVSRAVLRPGDVFQLGIDGPEIEFQLEGSFEPVRPQPGDEPP